MTMQQKRHNDVVPRCNLNVIMEQFWIVFNAIHQCIINDDVIRVILRRDDVIKDGAVICLNLHRDDVINVNSQLIIIYVNFGCVQFI